MYNRCRMPCLAVSLLVPACQTMPPLHRHTVQLEVGDPAPELSRVRWIQGPATSQWTPGQIYVIDFWAPWCGPCHAVIPGLTRLQEEYGEAVRVIGVAIQPKFGMMPVRKFLTKRPEMTYAVGEDTGRAVEREFWGALKSRSLPGAVVVGRAGRIAWAGNPHPRADQAELFDVVSKLVARGR